jgi:hypothetical protein
VSLAERTEPFTVADGLLTAVGGTLPTHAGEGGRVLGLGTHERRAIAL